MLRFNIVGPLLLLLILCQTCKPVSIGNYAASKEKSEQSHSKIQQNIEKPQSSFLELPSDVIKSITSKMRYHDLIKIARTSKLAQKIFEIEIQVRRIVRQLRLLDFQDRDTESEVQIVQERTSRTFFNANKKGDLLKSLAKLLSEMPRPVESFHITIFDQNEWESLQEDLLSIAQNLPHNKADKHSLTFCRDVKPTYEEFEILKNNFGIRFIFNLIQLCSTKCNEYKDLDSLVIMVNSFDFKSSERILAGLGVIELPENLHNLTIIDEWINFDYELPLYGLKLPKNLRRLDLINLALNNEIYEQYLPESLVILSLLDVKFSENVLESYRTRISQLQNLEYLHLEKCNLYEGVRSQVVPNVKKLGLDFLQINNFNWPKEESMPELVLSFSFGPCSIFWHSQERDETLIEFQIILKNLNSKKFKRKIIEISISILAKNPNKISLPILNTKSWLDLTSFSNLKKMSLSVPEIQLRYLKLPTSIETLSVHFDNCKTNLEDHSSLLSGLKDLKYLALKHIDLAESSHSIEKLITIGSLATSLKGLELENCYIKSLALAKGLNSLKYNYQKSSAIIS